MRKIFLLIILSQLCLASFAQRARTTRKEEKRKRISSIVKKEEDGVIVYHHQLVFGGKLATDGYGGFIEYGRSKSVKKSILFQLDISEKKSNKEDKQTNLANFGSTPVIYGKENYVYPIKLGVQFQNLLGNKSNKNGVSVTANYGGGLSMALVRPYLVQVIKNSNVTYVGYNSPDSNLFLDNHSIIGGPSFGSGWSQAKVTPGIYGKTALRFDYGTYNEVVSALEVGLTAELYSKNVPIMVYAKPRKFFFSAYAAIMFGKRK